MDYIYSFDLLTFLLILEKIEKAALHAPPILSLNAKKIIFIYLNKSIFFLYQSHKSMSELSNLCLAIQFNFFNLLQFIL